MTEFEYQERSEPVARDLQEQLRDVLATTPAPEHLTDRELEEVMDTLAGLEYDVASVLNHLADVAAERGIEVQRIRPIL